MNCWNNMKIKFDSSSFAFFVLATLILSHTRADAQTNAFTYQGRLNAGGSTASGSYDLRFAIYDAGTNGALQGTALTNAATVVSNGLFTVTLNFGNQFPGADRWLDISVRTNGGGAFIALSPRQQITSSPYAIMAGNALTATTATSATSAASATTATTANNFSGALAGNVTGTQGATVVATVGGVSAANVASGANAGNAAATANTANTIVKRDASGNFSAGSITANSISAANLFGAIFMTGMVSPSNLTPFWTCLNGDSIQTLNGPSFGAPMPVAGTITALNLRLDGITAGANTVTVTIYKNGTATAMTATANISAAGATVTASDTTHTVAVAAGDSLSIGYVQSNSAPIDRIGVSTRFQ
jgi:hypothetical protein